MFLTFLKFDNGSIVRYNKNKMVSVAQLVRALDCGSSCRRFESGHSPCFGNLCLFDCFYAPVAQLDRATDL